MFFHGMGFCFDAVGGGGWIIVSGLAAYDLASPDESGREERGFVISSCLGAVFHIRPTGTAALFFSRADFSLDRKAPMR